MSTTVRMSNGLAFSPDRELKLFAEMAKQGKHLVGTARAGHAWKFEDGPAEDVIFDSAQEPHPSPDYFEIFEAAGWTHVYSLGDYHFFKAPPGTKPVHSNEESKREELRRNVKEFARYAAITVAVFVLALLGLRQVDWPEWAEMTVIIVLMIPVVYTVMPLCGYLFRLRDSKSRS